MPNVENLQLLVVREEPLTIQPPQLLQGLVLDLADALPADLQLPAHLGQRVVSDQAGRRPPDLPSYSEEIRR